MEDNCFTALYWVLQYVKRISYRYQQDQAHSAHHIRGQWIEPEMKYWGKAASCLQKTILLRSRSALSLQSEMRGRWGKKVKSHESCKYLLEWQALGRRYVNFFLPHIHRWTKSWTKALKLNTKAEGQDSLRQVIIYDYNNKSKSKKQFQLGVRIDFSLQQVCIHMFPPFRPSPHLPFHPASLGCH